MRRQGKPTLRDRWIDAGEQLLALNSQTFRYVLESVTRLIQQEDQLRSISTGDWEEIARVARERANGAMQNHADGRNGKEISLVTKYVTFRTKRD